MLHRNSIPPRVALLALFVFAWTAATALQSPSASQRWYKGNLHTHTINSDGDSSPDAVARWYKEHRYDFLALTDHNYFTDPQGLNSFLAAKEKFLLITAEEVTSKYESKPVHVNAFRLKSTIQPQFGSNVVETLQKNVDHIRSQGALPSLNHPNFVWAFTPPELAQINNLKLFEVYNGHPTTNEHGGGGAASLDEMWDHVLSAGKRIWGIAVDDAHAFKTISPDLSNPGRGWIHVRAPNLSEEALLKAIEAGDFYSSTGVELESLEQGAGSVSLKIKERRTEKYAVRFIGKDGKVLAETFDNPASYRLKSGEPYVRAQVLDSNGRKAWTQPVFAE